MSGGAAFWIKGASVDDAELTVRLGTWRDRVPETYSDYLRVENDDAPPRELMAGLSSERQTDVLWVAMQSTVDAFELVHYRNGALIRELVYGCYETEREWERVSGTQQAWERWSRDPVVGDMEPMPDAWAVIEHYGLSDQRPAGAKVSASTKVSTRAKPKRTVKAKATAKAKPKAKATAKPRPKATGKPKPKATGKAKPKATGKANPKPKPKRPRRT